jgi:carboxylate-amine ligase
MKTTNAAPDQTFEDLNFANSTAGTIGVEVELQVLDHQTGDLAPGAQRILDTCLEEKIDGVTGEFLLSMLEVRTGICSNVAEVRNTLVPLIHRVRTLASAVGFDIGFGGTHPFGRPAMSAVSPGERYQRIQERQAFMAYQEAVYGLHIHIGVPSGDAAIGAVNLLVPYLPHLVALSANSPFWQGLDTGFASARARMFRPTGNSGLPPHFENWQGLCDYCEVLHGAGLIEATKDIYWDIRPRPGLGTIEFRVCDVPGRFSELLGIVALVRAMVLDALQAIESNPKLVQGDNKLFWLAGENSWLASRYGLLAQVVREPGMEPTTISDDVARLIERLDPLAVASGDGPFLRALTDLTIAETGTARQRHTYRETGSWRAVVDSMNTTWNDELTAAEAQITRRGRAEAAPAPLQPATSDG